MKKIRAYTTQIVGHQVTYRVLNGSAEIEVSKQIKTFNICQPENKVVMTVNEALNAGAPDDERGTMHVVVRLHAPGHANHGGHVEFATKTPCPRPHFSFDDFMDETKFTAES